MIYLRLQAAMVGVAILWVMIDWNMTLPRSAQIIGSGGVVIAALIVAILARRHFTPQPHPMTELMREHRQIRP